MPQFPRPVYAVLSARSLSYAKLCLASLLRNSIEPLSLTLITDGVEDKQALTSAMEEIGAGTPHAWTVHEAAAADERADDVFAGHPHIRRFRHGHPCWRKITDPALFAPAGGEMILIDPDVYFPNRFRFEPTPPVGVLLMWQAANCLYPFEVVEQAFRSGIRMADHTDIGVCQATNPLDWDALEDLIGRLGGESLPAWSPHVESIIWAALAMISGGGHLDPHAWYCWTNTPGRRLRANLMKAEGAAMLRDQRMDGRKAFHAGGRCKAWLPAAEAGGLLVGGETLDGPTPIRPFREYTFAAYSRARRWRKVFASLGGYRIFGRHG